MKRVIVMMLTALTTFGTGLQASDKYGSGKQFADSLKGNGCKRRLSTVWQILKFLRE